MQSGVIVSVVSDKSSQDLAVQVVCITYNQEKYIAEALDSFIRQKTSFRFNIMVGDDCSTDRTAEIVDEYVKKYPGLVVRVPREHNLGASANILDVCSKCTAPYLAFCEGDDFWTDDSKLQLQFDYMESHKETNVCFTQTIVKFEGADDAQKHWGNLNSRGEMIRPDCYPHYSPLYDLTPKTYLEAFIKTGGFYSHTSSLFYRWNYSIIWPEWMMQGQASDILILVFQTGIAGHMHYIPKVTSCYRRSSVGVTGFANSEEYFIKTRFEAVVKYSRLYEFFKDSEAADVIRSCILKFVREYFNSCSKINAEEDACRLLAECPGASWTFLCNTMQAKNQAEWQRNRMSSVIGRPAYNLLADPANLKVVKQFVLTAAGIDLSKPQSILNAKKAANVKKKPSVPGIRVRVRNFFKKIWDLLEFDSAYYLNLYPDVADAGVEPKSHYIKYGYGEGRKAHGDNVTMKSLFAYWWGALYPKHRNRWAFGGFYAHDNSFMDNVKYLFLHTVKFHPEIEAVWLAGGPSDLEMLRRQGLPAVLLKSKEGRAFLRSAAIAVTDHFRSVDYDNNWGFNGRTKVVNLWHGVGVKGMVVKPGGRIANTTVPGARLSPDILKDKSDSLKTKIRKSLLYFFRAPFRELFEKYFIFLTPGPVIDKYNASLWNIPEKNRFHCGMPRCRYLYNAALPDRPRVIYAPTYRWNVSDEQKLVDDFINSLERINEWLEKADGTLTLRLHPHTWRAYGSKISVAIAKYKRIIYDTEKDVYGRLGQYSVMISDYSSIAYDFLLMNRPVIFFDFDLDTYTQHDCDFWFPYEEYSPGLKAKSWEEVISCMDRYTQNPELDNDFRDRIMSVQYYRDRNTRDDAEKIVAEIKRRLGI